MKNKRSIKILLSNYLKKLILIILQVWKLIYSFYKDNFNILIIISLFINSILPIAKPNN